MIQVPIAPSSDVFRWHHGHLNTSTYGIHIVTFTMCVWSFLNRSSDPRLGKPVVWLWLLVAISLFVVGTVDVSFNLYHNMITFVFYAGPGGAEDAFEELSTWLNVIRGVWKYVVGFISDAALLYRCWIICNRNWGSIALSLLLWFSALACAAVDLYLMCTLETMSSIPDERKIRPFLIAYFTTALAISLA